MLAYDIRRLSRWSARLRMFPSSIIPKTWSVAFMAAIAFGARVAPLAGNDSAAQVLQSRFGLTKLGENQWILPREIELRGKLAELPKRRERLISVEKDLGGLVQSNQRAWDETRPAAAALKQSLARFSSADPQRELIERQMKSLEAGATDPRKLGGRKDVRSLVVDLASQRCELLAAVAWIREAVPALVDQYMTLASDGELASALKQAGSDQRLGPQRSYKADLARLGDYERLAATPWLPTFEQGGHVRIVLLMEERSTATFTWAADEDQQVVITASTAEAAGLVVPNDAESEIIQTGHQREVAARRITLGYLRLGRCVLRGVKAYVLPPEAEDVGNRLGRDALAGHRVRLEPERLRLWIDEER